GPAGRRHRVARGRDLPRDHRVGAAHALPLLPLGAARDARQGAQDRRRRPRRRLLEHQVHRRPRPGGGQARPHPGRQPAHRHAPAHPGHRDGRAVPAAGRAGGRRGDRDPRRARGLHRDRRPLRPGLLPRPAEPRAGAGRLVQAGMSGDLARSIAEAGGALERDEHVSAVLRLRRACAVGVVTWPAFAAVDWFIVTFVHPGRLWFYLLLRGLGLFPLLLAVVVLYGRRMPGPAVLRWTEAGVCGALSALVSLSSIESGGLRSPIVLGVLLILLGRSAIIADRWQRALLPVGAIVLAHPLTLAFASPLSAELAAQFTDPMALASFVLSQVF